MTGSTLTLRSRTSRKSSIDRPGYRFTVAGLFAGIGGIELGLHDAGGQTTLLCELDAGCQAVLRDRFPEVPLTADVREVGSLPDVDILTAGFPCQDLSQAGRTAGIAGSQSSLIGHVFRLLDNRGQGPRFLLLENVSFMLHLDRGKAMRYLVDELEGRGFSWAYRIVDTQAFGLPQRRQRVIMLASRTEDPRTVLFADDAKPIEKSFSPDTLCGFYWTEGLRGLGWAVDAVPTIKSGSTIGIPSPPAIWNPRTRTISTPEIRDAERLQGFDADWTRAAAEVEGVRRSHRWKLVGNAVSVPVSRWIGERIARPGSLDCSSLDTLLPRGVAWPRAAWGFKGRVYPVQVSLWPVQIPAPSLADFLRFPLVPLSARAASGFLGRAQVSGLKFEEGFLSDVEYHVAQMSRLRVA
jgi:DNA (cytosine-5)-methyltransferase 1